VKRKVLASLLVIAVVASLVGAGTWAYFSATATSEGNAFGAGTMTFRIADPGATGHQVFNVSNMKPGQVVTGYIAVVNDSTPGLGMKWRACVSEKGTGILDNVLAVKVTLRPSTGYDYTALTSAGYTIAGPPDLLITDYTLIGNLGCWNSILVWATPAEAFARDWAAVYKLDVKMLESADYTYHGASYTGDMNFYATQYEI
jgi:predicted ribosomally synthesized peptide with SipW-like signal peptide